MTVKNSKGGARADVESDGADEHIRPAAADGGSECRAASHEGPRVADRAPEKAG